MKKGFTLVEIIVVIALIAFIGTVSFFGIRLVNKNIKENKLERIEDKILLAAEIYIETNKEVKNKVNEQGAIIPLNVLHNEGLINLDGIIDKNDDDYVLALLGSETPGEKCENTYKEGSWKIGSKTIYICTENTGGTTGGSNLAIINPESMSNSNKASREPFYFTGSNPYNYVNYNGNTYRILSVDPDDSLVLVGDNLAGKFNNKQMQSTIDGLGTTGTFSCDINTGKVKYNGQSGEKVDGVAYISAKDLITAKECYVYSFGISSSAIKNCTDVTVRNGAGWGIDTVCENVGSSTSGGTSISYLSWLSLKGVSDKGKYGKFYFNKSNSTNIAILEGTKYSISQRYTSCYSDYNATKSIDCDAQYKNVLYQKVHLKPCMKITTGVGSLENQYELKSSC